MENTFVRKDFYTEPPDRNANPEEWTKWAEQDDRQARADKARFTRLQNKTTQAGELPESSTVKIGGVWRQAVAFGFSGSVDEGTLTREVLVEASQEQDVEQVKQSLEVFHRRAGKRRNRNKARRANKRLAKREGYKRG